MIIFVSKKEVIIIPKKLCKKVNCNKLIDFKESYCDEHNYLKDEARKNYESKRYERDKTYIQFYNDSMWKETSKSTKLRHDGLCQYCLAKGYTRKAEVVDHFIPIKDDYDKRLDPDNLVSSCIRCNTLKEKDERLLRQNKISFEKYKEKWQHNL